METLFIFIKLNKFYSTSFHGQSKDDELLEMLIEEEKQLASMRYEESKQEAIQEKQMKKKNKEALIDELVSSL